MALKADRNNLSEYSKNAEQLAEHYKRTLILGNYTYEIANEFVIKDTIDLCRANTNSVLVKAGVEGCSSTECARQSGGSSIDLSFTANGNQNIDQKTYYIYSFNLDYANYIELSTNFTENGYFLVDSQANVSVIK